MKEFHPEARRALFSGARRRGRLLPVQRLGGTTMRRREFIAGLVGVAAWPVVVRAQGGKWLELLTEIAPRLNRVAIMFNPDTSTASAFMPSLETVARSLKVVPTIAHVHSDVEIESAIVALGREPRGGLVVMP